jgi:hypothetical protein
MAQGAGAALLQLHGELFDAANAGQGASKCKKGSCIPWILHTCAGAGAASHHTCYHTIGVWQGGEGIQTSRRPCSSNHGP